MTEPEGHQSSTRSLRPAEREVSSPLRRAMSRVTLVLLATGSAACLLAMITLILEVGVLFPPRVISENAATFAKFFSIVPGVPLLLAAVCAPFAIPACLILAVVTVPLGRKSGRYRAAPIVFLCIALAIGEVALVFHCERMTYNYAFRVAFTATASRTQPLIDAVEAYKQSSGEYPHDLESLVPAFLSEVPHTGLAGYPEFEYTPANGDSQEFENYELLVETPQGGANWDVFVYWPEGEYPDYLYGGFVERIGGWAYVHE